MKFTNETSTEYIMLFPYIIPSIETKPRRLVIAFGWLHWSFFIFIGPDTPSSRR